MNDSQFKKELYGEFPEPLRCSTKSIPAPSSQCSNVAEYIVENDTSTPSLFCSACMPEAVRRITLRTGGIFIRRVNK